MARIEGLPERKASLLTRLAYRLAKRRVGKLPEPMTVLAHHSRLFRAYCFFELALGKSRHVDERLKALAGIKAAALVGCPF